MKKLIFVLTFLLCVPLFAAAQNSLDQANNVRSGMNGSDNSSTAPSNPYMGSSGAGSSASGNVPNISRSQASNTNSGVNINDVAAGNPGQNTDWRDFIQSQQELQAARENSLTSYCLIVLGVALASVVALSVFKSAPGPVTAAIFLALWLAALVMIVIGFVKLLKSYPDGLGPSIGNLAVCSAMLFGALVLMGGSVFSPLGLFGILATSFAFIGAGKNKNLAQDMVSQTSSSNNNNNQHSGRGQNNGQSNTRNNGRRSAS